MADIHIRREQPADYQRIAEIIRAAFRDDPHSDQQEAALVARLRKSPAYIPELALVAETADSLVGHILLTQLHIQNADRSFPSLALAPVSVQPDHQRQGVGSQLIREAHKQARQLGHTSIVLIGHSDYYPRFGYQPASTFGICFPFEVPDENAMAVEISPGALAQVSGEVVYPPAFFG